ncbi:MAG: discoidin domain-containing protein [Kiritimatiellaeota bacterium]|nr:discoidin domain-containing protein [Kiritimatiellota bacterium]
MNKTLIGCAITGWLSCAAAQAMNYSGVYTTAPAAIVDGRADTRWGSEWSDAQWIAVDLGGNQRVGRVELDWENAFAKELAIEVSSDGENWKEVQHVNNSGGGTQVIRFDSVETRWVRMRGIKRATGWEYSIFEMRVFP